MSSGVVFAKASTVLHGTDGLPWRLNAGQAWDANDPLVRLYPSAFSAEPLPEHVASTRLGVDLPPWLRTEQATREPGEVRPLRRAERGA